MIREIITPKNASLTLLLPDEMIGKKVEIIAFEIESETHNSSGTSKENRLRFIEELTAPYQVDLSNYKFDRNEANDYNT